MAWSSIRKKDGKGMRDGSRLMETHNIEKRCLQFARQAWDICTKKRVSGLCGDKTL